MSILVADVGGTNTRVGSVIGGNLDLDSVRRFRNAEFASLGDVLRSYLREVDPVAPETVCVAVAGPVRHGVGRLTNRDWIVSEDSLCRDTGATRGLILNDLAAQGYALDAVSLTPLGGSEQSDPNETRLVVGIGTGFNAAPVYRIDGRLHVMPSECGHASLPTWNADSSRLAQRLVDHHGFASIEDLLSGRGMPTAHRLLNGLEETCTTQQLFAEAEASETGPAATTIATAVGALGRVSGDLALTFLPFGGIILIGGMGRALVPFFERFDFFSALHGKGRFSEYVKQFNVFSLDDDYAALYGCANFARTT